MLNKEQQTKTFYFCPMQVCHNVRGGTTGPIAERRTSSIMSHTRSVVAFTTKSHLCLLCSKLEFIHSTVVSHWILCSYLCHAYSKKVVNTIYGMRQLLHCLKLQWCPSWHWHMPRTALLCHRSSFVDGTILIWPLTFARMLWFSKAPLATKLSSLSVSP